MNEYIYDFDNHETPKLNGTYAQNKAVLRDFAVEWQWWALNTAMYWSDAAFWGDYFTRQGKRYGLLREFRENGVC